MDVIAVHEDAEVPEVSDVTPRPRGGGARWDRLQGCVSPAAIWLRLKDPHPAHTCDDPPCLSPICIFSFLLAFTLTSPRLDLTGVSEVKNEKLALNLLKLRLAFSLSLFFFSCFDGDRKVKEMFFGE